MGRRNDLTAEERSRLGQYLLTFAVGVNLPKGKIKEAAERFAVSCSTVYLMWIEVQRQMGGNAPLSLTSKKRSAVRKKIVQLDQVKMKTIPYQQRGTIRDLGAALGVSKSTVGRWKKEGVIRAHTNAITPSLTEANKYARLKFSLSWLKWDFSISKFQFKSMFHVIHIDEKWFYMTKAMERYYMCPGETEPHRSCQSKRYIPKVMFLCAVSRPIYSNEGVLLFDGKIGMWPFTKREPAKRSSINRVAGTMVTKPMESINKTVTKKMLLRNVIPAIKSKWPANESKNIIIQWDNAPPHIKNSDQDFREAASTAGWNIQLQFQPPNSPDTNINDLGWFRSIDTLKTDVQAKTVDDLVTAVKVAFQNLSPVTLNKIFVSLQLAMLEIMKLKGENNFDVPHIGKDRLLRAGELETDRQVELDMVVDCIKYLQEKGQHDGLESIMSELALGGVFL